MNRRQALQGLTAVTTPFLASCSSISPPRSKGIVLGKVHVANFAFYPQRIQVVVMREGETLVERNILLSRPPQDGVADNVIIEPSWSQTQAMYTVRATHVTESGEAVSRTYERTFTREDFQKIGMSPKCLGVEVNVGSGYKAKNPHIEIDPTRIDNPCGDR